VRGLDWQTLQLPLAAGMNQKSDKRALQAPELARCVDVQFDELGGLQPRYPFSSLGSDILGGGSLTDPRRVVANGDELLVFTKDALYSRLSAGASWVRRGTHLAVAVDEQPVFIDTGDQIECDRAELGGIILYAWSTSDGVYVGARDKATGMTLLAPYQISAGASRPRLVALSTRILMFYRDPAIALTVVSIDPTDITSTTLVSPTGIVVTDPPFDAYFDAVRIPNEDAAVVVYRREAPWTSYGVATVAANLAITSVTKARFCDGPIAVSCAPAGDYIQVVRTSGTDIVGDLLLRSTLADVFTAQAIGTAPGSCYQVAAAHRSTTDASQHRCYVFWTAGNSDLPASTAGAVKVNWIDTGNALGTQAKLVHAASVASRAFERDGHVFVNVVFTGVSEVTTSYSNFQLDKAALQNTYFLYRDDAFLVAKQAPNRAGGRPSRAHLPGVAVDPDDDTTYRWCGTERRIVPLGNGKAYADRGPRDIALAFDSDDARRCVRMGETLYIACGEGLLQYDGVELTEVGFHHTPYAFTLNTVTGSQENGVYFYKATARWQNAKGDVDTSSTAAAGGIEVTAAPKGTQLEDLTQVYITHKTRPAIEVWRTIKNPTTDAPYYRATDNDPSVASGSNRYLVNDSSGTQVDFTDELVDSDARELGEEAPVDELENLPPPAAKYVAASNTRIFLAGVAGEPHRVWYSKQRNEGEVAAFHDALVVDIPPDGGEITGVGFIGETPVVFRESATYTLLNDGFGNTGSGQNYVARKVPGELGAVNHASIAEIDRGLVFKSAKGWQLLNRGFSIDYIGGQVADYDSETPLAANVMKGQFQLRILTSSRMLLLDTLGGQWGEWSISDGRDACLWNAVHVYLSSTGPKQQQSTYATADYGLDVETAWIKVADLQGFGKVRWFAVLGEYISAHKLRVRVARDYWKDGDGVYFDDKTWTPSPAVAGGPLEVRHGPSIKSVVAIKIRLTAVSTVNNITPPAGGALKLTGLALEIGFKRGINRLLPAAQKQ
jgi:hypothetical protein